MHNHAGVGFPNDGHDPFKDIEGDTSMSRARFRDFLPPQTPDDRRYALRYQDAYTHVDALPPLVANMLIQWEALSRQPFVGVTTDGTVIPDLYVLQPNGAPIHSAVEAALHLLNAVSQQERAALCYPIDARAWRMWNNTEFYLHHIGLRLEETSMQLREAMLAVVQVCLSAQGFEKARDVMRLNAFLGELVHGPRVLNEWSYNFSLFGTPSTVEPWGWSLFGHHLALSCFMLGEQMILSPLFLGAEPTSADTGPFAGIHLFQDEERNGLQLVQSLSPLQQRQAQIYQHMIDPAMPPGRLHPADHRQLGGAFQDNRIIPYEGVCAAHFTARQRQQLLDLIRIFLILLPTVPLSARLEEIERHLQNTYFCWIGAYEEHSAFYYRIQSPVVMIEYDEHPGIFLTHVQPEKFHVHTIIRTPNGNDYGMDLLQQHYQRAHPGQQPGGAHTCE
jgi:hypothetical protein